MARRTEVETDFQTGVGRSFWSIDNVGERGGRQGFYVTWS